MNTNELLGMLPPFQGAKVTVTKKQSVPRIMKEILAAHQDYARDYDRIADYFYTGDEISTAEKLFDFCKDNLTYKVESDQQQTVRSPTAILVLGELRGVDCKHYASFIGGVLDALNRSGKSSFDWFYRFASYSLDDKIPEHIFVVVRQYGVETWVDPVLDYFDERVPYPIFIKDIKPKKMALYRISGVNGGGQLGSPLGYRSTNFAAGGSQLIKKNTCGSLPGGTRKKIGCTAPAAQVGSVSSTGAMIQKLSPALAAVPVVGWIAAAGGTLIGTFLNIFGSKYNTSTDVRWLTAKFEYYVLGQAGATSDNHVNEGDTANAQKWFSYVLGVPIYDQLRYHALRGTSPQNGQSLGLSRDQRAKNYLASAPDAVSAGYTYQDALAATYPADQFGENNINGSWPPGSWKTFTAAPALIAKEQAAQDAATAAASPLGAAQVFAKNNQVLVYGAAALVLAFLILKK